VEYMLLKRVGNPKGEPTIRDRKLSDFDRKWRVTCKFYGISCY